MRPFKPLTIHGLSGTALHNTESEPPTKRRKTSPQAADRPDLACSSVLSSKGWTVKTQSSYARAPLKSIQNSASPPETTKPAPSPNLELHFSVLWRNFSSKKNKTWENDGVLSLVDEYATFYNSSGRSLGRMPWTKPLLPGSILSIAGKEIEIDNSISKHDFIAFTKGKGAQSLGHASNNDKPANQNKSAETSASKPKLSLKEQMRSQIQQQKTVGNSNTQVTSHQFQPRTAAFKQPLKENHVQSQTASEIPVPRHDPTAPGAVVFKRPKCAPAGQQLVDVVLDPILTKKLRQHQKEGVKFLYECVMELRDFGGQGCILADDMGLGKTLQTIALLWTLIKQNPVYRAAPVVKKALIVCPVSLIQNWKKEFKKWLGSDRLGVLEFQDPKTTRLSMFDGKIFNVMIIGYERLRMVADDLAEAHDIDIVICDEGHRLKTVKNKSAKAIESLNTPRRVILSGTPIQNDLGEFYAMVNFVNDGCLGSAKAFLKDFETPILKSRQPDATEEIIEQGENASEELARTTAPFILRRTADILSNFLPPKTEYVLFCKPTSEQALVYRNVVKSPMFRSALGNTDTALQLITILKKLCNSPALMHPKTSDDNKTTSDSLAVLTDMLPPGMSRYYQNSLSAKIRLLDVLLQQIRTRTDEKVVLVSNYTSTLDLMENLLSNSGFGYLRLDGSVPASKRQALVDEFNRTKPAQQFAFLLSAKAGGVGINLIGASRLILFDVDWNPATDDQAMARIHRQGQQHHCRIYRFLIKGSIEEKIWQRQVVKRGLAASIMNGTSSKAKDSMGTGKKGKATFSQEELKDLFRFDEEPGLRTHDLIGCACRGTKLDYEQEAPNDSADEPFWPGEASETERESSVEIPDLTEVMNKQRSNKKPDRAKPVVKPAITAKKPISNSGDEQDLHELMKYSHLDTGSICGMDSNDPNLMSYETAIDDQCLMHVLEQSQDVIAGGISYIFKKVSGAEIPPEEDIDAVVVKKEEISSSSFT